MTDQERDPEAEPGPDDATQAGPDAEAAAPTEEPEAPIEEPEPPGRRRPGMDRTELLGIRPGDRISRLPKR